MKANALLYAVTLIALSVAGTGQATNSPQSVGRLPRHATINMATGQLTRDTTQNPTSVTTVWANTDYTAYASPPPAGSEWLDWGVLSTTSGNDFVGEFTFGYATTALDTTVGGSGASLCANFYSGALGSCVESGMGITPDSHFCWSGLPGTTSSGVPAAWVISVTLTGGYEFTLPPGPFGFSLGLVDGQSGPLLCYAGTGGGGADGNGQVDQFDLYSPDLSSGTCASSSYGGAPHNYSSEWLTIAMSDRPCTTYTNYSSCEWSCIDWYNTKIKACQDACSQNGFTSQWCYLTCADSYRAALDACLESCAGGGYHTWNQASPATYYSGQPVQLSGGRMIGGVVLSGPGSVIAAEFSLLDIRTIPAGGFPPGTCFEDVPWIPVGPGTFDGNELWTAQVQIGGPGGVPYSDEGFIVRLDLIDSGEPYVKMGASVLLPINGGRNAGSNPASLQSLTDPLIGSTWTTRQDLTLTGHNFGLLVAYATPLSFALLGGQVILVNIGDPSGEFLGMGAQFGPVIDRSLPLPNDPGLIGFPFSSQAVHIGGVTPFALSNALDLVIGI